MKNKQLYSYYIANPDNTNSLHGTKVELTELVHMIQKYVAEYNYTITHIEYTDLQNDTTLKINIENEQIDFSITNDNDSICESIRKCINEELKVYTSMLK